MRDGSATFDWLELDGERVFWRTAVRRVADAAGAKRLMGAAHGRWHYPVCPLTGRRDAFNYAALEERQVDARGVEWMRRTWKCTACGMTYAEMVEGTRKGGDA